MPDKYVKCLFALKIKEKKKHLRQIRNLCVSKRRFLTICRVTNRYLKSAPIVMDFHCSSSPDISASFFEARL